MIILLSVVSSTGELPTTVADTLIEMLFPDETWAFVTTSARKIRSNIYRVRFINGIWGSGFRFKVSGSSLKVPV
jgi:hypothetical protein